MNLILNYKKKFLISSVKTGDYIKFSFAEKDRAHIIINEPYLVLDSQKCSETALCRKGCLSLGQTIRVQPLTEKEIKTYTHYVTCGCVPITLNGNPFIQDPEEGEYL